jgi:hypothetical protein
MDKPTVVIAGAQTLRPLRVQPADPAVLADEMDRDPDNGLRTYELLRLSDTADVTPKYRNNAERSTS